MLPLALPLPPLMRLLVQFRLLHLRRRLEALMPLLRLALALSCLLGLLLPSRWKGPGLTLVMTRLMWAPALHRVPQSRPLPLRPKRLPTLKARRRLAPLLRSFAPRAGGKLGSPRLA